MRSRNVTRVALALAVLAAFNASGRADQTKRKTWATEVFRKVQPSVVSISSEKKAASTSRWPFSPEENQRPRVSGMGTGVIIDQRGYILTNQHVVDKVTGVEVHLFDNTVLPARVIQQDPKADVAIIKVEAGKPLTPIAIGTSADLMIGEDVMTIGNAFGYEGTTGTGIIGALSRDVALADDQTYRNLIQTNAPINPGNSGGPLINVDGELIGINVATRSGAQGIGFAMPIDDVKRVAAELLSTRRLGGTWHGLSGVETVLPGTDRRCLVVTEVASGSPAESAGALPGDRLERLANLTISNALDVERALLDTKAGQRQELVVRRGTEEVKLPLELQPLPRAVPDASDQVFRLVGLRATPVRSEYVTPVSDKLKGGLYVHSVSANSPAARAQVQKGDILVGMSVGDSNFETVLPDNVLYILKQAEKKQDPSIRFYFIRRNILHLGELPVATAGTVANSTTR